MVHRASEELEPSTFFLKDKDQINKGFEQSRVNCIGTYLSFTIA